MKHLLLSLALSLAVSVAGAGETILLGVTPFPNKEITDVMIPLLAEDGYTLVVKEFTDYVQPNMAVAEKHLFANLFQHIPYLDNMNREKNLGLTWIAKVYIAPLGLYSRKISKLDELGPGSLITVPNDPTNEARALRLLEANGLITLKPGELVTIRAITDNPRKLVFREIDAPQLPRTLQDVTAAIINANFVSEAGLVASRDAIVREGDDSPYANVVVVREADKDSPAAKALVKASQSPEVKKYIAEKLAERGIIPAF